MVQELEVDQFAQVQALFSPLAHHLAVLSVIGGATPGRIWVDRLDNPQTAALLDPVNRGLYFVGKERNNEFNSQFNGILLDDIYPQIKATSQPQELTYYMHPERWERQARLLLTGTGAMVNQSQYFQLSLQKEERPPAAGSPPGRLRIVPLTAALIDQQELTHPLRKWVEQIYGDTERFLQHGVAYAALTPVGDMIAGWCVAVFCTAAGVEQRCELLAHVLETYRQQGVAVAMVQAVVADCYQRGISQVGGHCRLANTAAVHTAVRAGFTPKRSELIFHCWVNPIDNYFMQARRHELSGALEEQAEALRKAFILIDARVRDLPQAQLWQTAEQKRQAYEYAAVAYARVSDYWGAVDVLERAIYDLGWGEEEWIEWQKHEALDASVRHTESWSQFVREMGNILQNQMVFDDSDLPDLVS